MQIVNCTEEDIDTMLGLYRKAAEYQKANGYDHWKEFERSLLVAEIKEKRQWKILLDGQIACIFMVAYSDPLLWGERNSTDAIYLHRITTNPSFKGQNMMQHVTDWSRNHVKELGRKYIRMDTWASNKNLADYYVKCGFKIAGYHNVSETEAKNLPKHYSTLSLVLLEMEI